MWSSERRRALYVGTVTALVVGTFLSGCGFEPLYGRGARSPGVTASLSNVKIAPIADRSGQILHNLLSRGMQPVGPPDRPLYVLRIGLTESQYSFGIRKDDVATRTNLTLTASFSLWDPRTERDVMEGRTVSTNSFNILSNDFSNVSAEKNARERGIQQIAQDIQIRVAAFLSSPQAEAGRR